MRSGRSGCRCRCGWVRSAQGTAWESLKLATSEDSDGQLLELTGQMPLRTDLATTFPDYFEANPGYETFADQAERVADVPSVANSVEVWQAFRDEYSAAVIFGTASVEEFLSGAAETIDGPVAE